MKDSRVREGRLGRRPQPHVVIQSCRNRLRHERSGSDAGRRTNMDFTQLSDAAVAHEFARAAHRSQRVQLRAVLENGAIALRRIHQRAAFADGVAQRLLAVHILARLHGRNGDRRVPVVRRRDGHGLHVRTRQQLPEVRVGIRRLKPQIPRIAIASWLPHVAHGDTLHVGIFCERAPYAAHAASAADETDGDAIGGCHGTAEAQGRCGHDQRETHRRAEALNEAATRNAAGICGGLLHGAVSVAGAAYTSNSTTCSPMFALLCSIVARTYRAFTGAK